MTDVTLKVKFALKFSISLFSRVINLFIPIKDSLILFHSSDLLGYNDNVKYLFEYLSRNSSYECIWVTKNHELCDYLTRNSYKSVLYPSLKSIICYLRCSVCISGETSPPDGFGFLNRNSFKISLSHGYGPRSTNSADGKLYKTNLDVVNSLNKFDLMGFSSDYTEMLIGRGLFLFPSYKTYKTGLPRCDQLLDIENVLLNMNEKFICKTIFNNLNCNSKIYLYAPTWRTNGVNNFPLLNDYCSELNEFNRVLVENNTFFLISAHKLSKFNIDISSFSNIKLFSDNYDFDITRLLTEVDCLISDYSSIISDFSLLNRTILFYMPDYDYYFNYGLNEDFKNNLPGDELSSLNDLISYVKGENCMQSQFISYNFINYRNKYYDLNLKNSCEIYLRLINNKKNKII